MNSVLVTDSYAPKLFSIGCSANMYTRKIRKCTDLSKLITVQNREYVCELLLDLTTKTKKLKKTSTHRATGSVEEECHKKKAIARERNLLFLFV